MDALQAKIQDDILAYMSTDCEKFYAKIPTPDRSHVCLSYAQSMDGYIASGPNQQTILSGNSSLVLTHKIRNWCDAILVGVNTVTVDNPKLSVRLPNTEPASKLENPLPIILDPFLRIPLDRSILNSDQCRRPLIICSNQSIDDFIFKIQKLNGLGARIMECEYDVERFGGFNLQSLLESLHSKFAIRRVMVEGGSLVIRSFLSSQLVDLCVVTQSPQYLFGGISSTGTSDKPIPVVSFASTRSFVLDNDIIICGTRS